MVLTYFIAFAFARLPAASEGKVISGAHVILYSKDADADRAFFRDVLGFQSVNAGHGWLIFALPPAERHFIRPMKMAPTNFSFCATT